MRQAVLDLEMPAAPPLDLVSIRRRVARCVKMLDDVGPPDWRERVDREKVDIQNYQRCIYGQVFGGFYEGCQEMHVDPRDEAVQLGLNIADSKSPTAGREFALLTRTWKDVLSRPARTVKRAA